MSAEPMTVPSMPTIDVATIEPPVNIKDSELLQRGAHLFVTHGCLLIKNVFDASFVRELHAQFTSDFRDYFVDKIFDDAHVIDDKRIMVTLSLEGLFSTRDFYAPPKIYPILEFLLTKLMIVAGMGCVIALPGSKEMRTHRDYFNIYDPGFYFPGFETFVANGPPYAISLGIPLVPITRLTGSTRFWPGTHLGITRPDDPSLGPGVDFETELGSCYLFDYRVLHGSVANTSDEVRPLLYNVYSRPWFRDPKNYPKQSPINISEEQLSRLPAEDQKLFSWALVDGKNGLCHCDSGLLYKRCHGKSELKA